jgi:hypothetical protein
MKKILVLAALPLLATPAFADVASQIAAARAEAVTASTTADIEGIQSHLHRAANCLVNSDSGSYRAEVGNPCDGQGDGAIADTTLPLQKQKLKDALITIGSGCTQTEVTIAQRRAREVIAQLDQAKAMTQ